MLVRVSDIFARHHKRKRGVLRLEKLAGDVLQIPWRDALDFRNDFIRGLVLVPQSSAADPGHMAACRFEADLQRSHKIIDGAAEFGFTDRFIGDFGKFGGAERHAFDAAPAVESGHNLEGSSVAVKRRG